MSLTAPPRVAVIVVAAGAGTRLAADAPKAFVGIDQHTVLHHALRGVFAAQRAQVIVVAPAGREGAALTEAAQTAGDRAELVRVVTGGPARQSSVAAGLAAVWPDVEVVLVHDAARALTPGAVFDRVVAAVGETGWGIVPATPVVDTLKRIDGRRVTSAVDRAGLAAAQTPQGFRRDILDAAYAAASAEFTDDAALVAAAGHVIGTIDGDALAFKITTPADLQRARMLLQAEVSGVGTAPWAAVAEPVAVAESEPVPMAESAPPRSPRVGVGTDVHRFGGTGPLWLAGLEWPAEPALSGHSDGDAVAHAVVDALLSAAGLGDIGTHFGTSRPEYLGAHAAVFLARTRALLAEAGWSVGNVAVQLQAQRPRFSARRTEAEASLSAALGAPVSVTATTTDGLGFVGRGEGVAAFAVALILPA